MNYIDGDTEDELIIQSKFSKLIIQRIQFEISERWPIEYLILD